MKIPISKRLLTCCNYIAPGDRVADVGTDHGYLGIWLLTNAIARSVIASDIVPGPLSAAKRNAEKFGCLERMEFYLSDGVQAVPRDFDTLVCAGMGADTMVSIISSAPWLYDSRYRLILQCQSKTPMLRKYLSDRGFRIRRETVVRDGRFLYTVMEVIYQPGYELTPGQWYFPPALLEEPASELPEYYSRVLRSLRLIVDTQKNASDPNIAAALAELEALKADPSLHYLWEDVT